MGGTVAPGYERVREAFEAAQANDAGGAQLAVYRHGELVVDLWTGRDPAAGRDYGPGSITVLMSCSKAIVALICARLAGEGRLDPEAPVARYWPGFAAGGKDGVTVAHLLTHSAGLCGFDPDAGIDAEAMLDWDRCCAALAAQAPLWEPGSAYAYHAITYGYLLGEVIRRITGRKVGRYLAEEIAGPLGLDLWIGLPDGEQHRVAEHRRTTPGAGEAGWRALFAGAGADPDAPLIRAFIAMFVVTDQLIDAMNQPRFRTAEIPAGNAIGTARSLAKLYASAIGEVDGFRLLPAEALAAATAPRTDGLTGPGPMARQGARPEDGQRFGLGFELPRTVMPMMGPRSFGHPGAGGRIAYGDPESGIAAAYACNSLIWDGLTVDPRWAWNNALRDIVLNESE
jgi:CubicO group peptidase (beta-lactamase class C family)